MKFAFYSLGCKTNQFETAALERLCREKGHSVVDFNDDADVYIINTCTVTGTGGRKSRTVIRHAKRRARAGAVVAVCGCLGQTSPDEVAAAGADIVCGVSDRALIIDRAAEYFSSSRSGSAVFSVQPPKEFEILPSGGIDGRTRALLKVEDGCNNFCSYCIIPYARGRVRSLCIRDAVCEIKRLKDEGFREAVVTGIEISSYGQDTGESLTELIKALCSAANGGMRIRLGSLEPCTITEEFCRELSVFSALCPHFHLSLQSGCDSVLKRMNRKYTTDMFYQSVCLLRRYFPDCAVTTDLITGFPGESELEFNRTLEFIKKCAFSAMHIFPYSIRKGTPAAAMSGQISKSVKEKRAKLAAAAAQQMQNEFLNSMRGKTVRVLFERETDGLQHGHSENYCEVSVSSAENLQNKMLDVIITDVDGHGLLGKIRGEL